MRGLNNDAEARETVGALMDFHEHVDKPEMYPQIASPTLRLGAIKLQNFGSHIKTLVEFKTPITWIAGSNNAGKSTIAEAIEYVLTGSGLRGVNGRGTGVGDVVNPKGKGNAFRVSARLRDGGDVQREWIEGKANVRLSDAAKGADPSITLLDRLKVTAGLIRASMNAFMLLDADHEAGKRLLLEALDVRVPVGDQQLTLEQLDVRYKNRYDSRAVAKRAKAQHRVPAEPESPRPAPVVEISAHLKSLRDQLTALLEQGAEDRGKRSTLRASLDAAQKERDALTRQIEAYPRKLDELLDEVEAEITAKTAATPTGELPDAEREELASLRERLVTDGGRLKMAGASITGIETHDPSKGCVLSSDIACPVDAKAFKGHLAALKKQVTQLERRITEATARVTFLEGQAQTASNEASDHERDLRGLLDRRSDLTSRVQNRQHARESLEAVQGRIAQIEADLEALGPDVVDPAVTDLELRIATGEDVIANARHLAHEWDVYEAAVAEEAKLAKDVDRLEREVELLGPKGARVAALDAALVSFLQLVNDALQRFGYTLAIEVDPWCVLVNGRPAARLSTSERLRVGFCLQLSIAEVTGFDFALFDNTEWLVDPEIRDEFVSLLMDWVDVPAGDTPRQAVVIQAQPGDWLAPRVPGIAVYRVRLENGVSQVLCEFDGAMS